MTIFQKTRELADMILASEESKHAADTRANYLANETAQQKMESYTALQQEVQTKMENGKLTQEEFRQATEQLTQMGGSLKSDPIIGDMIAAQNQFNTLVNQVMQILKSAITGEEESGCNGCHSKGDCSGCKEGH